MRINHAIIGCGRVSHNHLYACSKLKNVDVVHFCDVDLNKAKELSSKVPLAFCCSDYTEIISNPRIDSVSVCTDHGSHYDIAIKCIQNDKHVIIEKPVCIRDEDARELEIISKMHPNVTISVVSQHRYDPLVNAVYNIIQSASIGKVTAISGFVQCSKKEEYYNGWRGKLSTEGGSALINQGIHTLDLMIWMGGNIEKVFAFANKMKFLNNETEDNICAALLFSNGAIGTLVSTNTSSVEWDSYIDVVGESGSIRFTTDYPNRILSVMLTKNPEVADELKRYETYRTEPPVGMHYYGISHNPQLKNFFNTIAGKDRLKVGLHDGVQTLKIVNMIYNSARNIK